MHDGVAVEIVKRINYLMHEVCLLLVLQLHFLFKEQVVEGTVRHVLHNYAEVGRETAYSHQQDDVRMPKLRQHVDLRAEFRQQFLSDVWVEYFLNRYLQAFVTALVDYAKATHGYLFTKL